MRIAVYLCFGALLATSAAIGAPVASFPYTVTNQTHVFARIFFTNEDCKREAGCSQVVLIVSPLYEQSITMKRSGHYEVLAQFFYNPIARGDVTQRPFSIAQTSLYIEPGAKSRVIETDGRYSLEP